MPKNKRARRHRHRLYYRKTRHQTQNKNKNDTLEEYDNVRTCTENESKECSNDRINLSLTDAITPLNTWQNIHRNECDKEITYDNYQEKILKTMNTFLTPVNKERSCLKTNKESFNCTNLNFLFNLESLGDDVKVRNNFRGSKNLVGCVSNPDLRHCKLDRDKTYLLKNKSSCNLYNVYNTLGSEDSPPGGKIENKIRKNTYVDISKNVCNTPKLRFNEIESKCGDEVKVNNFKGNSTPTLSKMNNISLSELSFFSPDLFNLKSVSTPIERNEILKSTTEKKINVNPFLNNKELIEENNYKYINTNSNNLKENIVEKHLKNENIFVDDTFSFNKKVSFRANISKNDSSMCNRNNKKVVIDMLKSNNPIRRVSLEKSDSFINVGKANGRIWGRIKRFYTKCSTKLVTKLFEICAWLGLTIKTDIHRTNCLHKIETPATTLSELNDFSLKNERDSSKKCDKCREQINLLNEKIEHLRIELNDFKQKSLQFEEIKRELALVNEKMVQFDEIKKELREVKQILENFNKVSNPSKLPPPPPPPPPPPFPSLPLLVNTPVCRPKIGNKKLEEKKGNENVRPVISLEDILKVKLKKVPEKPQSHRRISQPIISSEMLSQIKLVPVSSRSHHASSTLNEISSNSPTLNLSPHSNLTRILNKVDPNVRRVKRLKHSGCFSFDNVFRKTRIHSREREACTSDSVSMFEDGNNYKK